MHANSTIVIFAWLALLGAFCAWAAVVLFAGVALQEREQYVARENDANQALVRSAADVRMRALIQDSAPHRARLGERVHAELLQLVESIEAVGDASGVDLQVSDATPIGNSTNGGTSPLHAVAFVVQADGSFSALMKTVALLETLPLASSLETVDVSRTPLEVGKSSAGNASWHLNVRVHILTAAPISS